MIRQSLNGIWQFQELPHGEWMPAEVPGYVHLDLLRQGRIPDPYYRDNENSIRWIGERDWEYQREFTLDKAFLDGERIFLVFNGLDTLAKVKFNGQEIGRAENMFRRYRWEITPLLRDGVNQLNVGFLSPVAYVTSKQTEMPLISPSESVPGGPYLRKAAYQFGWDWAPALPSVGIWKDAWLETYREARLVNVHTRQIHEGGVVYLRTEAILQQWGSAEIQLRVRVKSPSGEILECLQNFSGARGGCEIEIPHPELWWPNGYGDQPLYHVTLMLEANGEVLDQREIETGLRKVELIREPDQWGESFSFKVNDVAIFVKGSNWIPADSFPTQITRERLEQLIRSAAETHQNMLRVWGGGYYEADEFYELCDHYGILVWQDFMFSCADYPFGDPEFLENVHVEIVQNIRRIREHACIALWCGNNEIEWGWVDWGWLKPGFERYKAAYERFFYQTLPAILREEDPDRDYWPSSPSSGEAFQTPNSPKVGDAHYWEVWHGRKPFSAYQEQFPRFMSEFGFQSLPPLETVEAFTLPEDRNLTSYVLEQHQKSPVGNDLILSQLAAHFRIPKDFDSLVYLSMILQAEGIRHGVEHWRRSRERVSGTLYWQLDDCWPAISWSSIDYFGRWKALHYLARDFYAPVMISAIPMRKQVDLVVVNDHTQPETVNVEWVLQAIGGQVFSAGHGSADIQARSAGLVKSLDFSNLLTPENSRSVVLTYRLAGKGRWKLLTFAPDKYVEYEDPHLDATIELNGNKLTIQITSHSLARYVEIEILGEKLTFSDNYFDLPSGESISVTACLSTGNDVERLQNKLVVRSLYDSFSHPD